MTANLVLDIASHYGSLTLPSSPDDVGDDVMSDLSRAVYVGDLRLVEDLIRQGVQVNALSRSYDNERRVWRWESPIATAARLGHMKVLRTLVEAGATMDLSDPAVGKSPLHWACARGHLDAARFLIERGACVNKTDFYSETPIVEAIGRRDLAMVRMILDHGAKLNVTLNYDRDSALLFALLINEAPIARLLLQAGAHAGHINREGEDSLLVLLSHHDHTAAAWWDLLRIVVYLRPLIRDKHVSLLRARPLSPACDLIQAARDEPWPLRLLCRVAIRRRLLSLSEDTSILSRLERLPLAPWLKAYLRFDYI